MRRERRIRKKRRKEGRIRRKRKIRRLNDAVYSSDSEEGGRQSSSV